jgi:hypothetical protein
VWLRFAVRYAAAWAPPRTTVLMISTSTRVPAGFNRFAQRPIAVFAALTLTTVWFNSAVPPPF